MILGNICINIITIILLNNLKYPPITTDIEDYGDNSVLIYKIEISKDINSVWQYLSIEDKLKLWISPVIDVNFSDNGYIKISFTPDEDIKHFTQVASITKIIEEKYIKLKLKNSEISINLEKNGNVCSCTVKAYISKLEYKERDLLFMKNSIKYYITNFYRAIETGKSAVKGIK